VSTDDSDEEYWKRDPQIPGESDQLLQFVPWKEAHANPDRRRFNFAIILLSFIHSFITGGGWPLAVF